MGRKRGCRFQDGQHRPSAPGVFSYIPGLHAAFAESNCLLQREIDDDEAIDSYRFAICEELGLPVAQYRVVIAHEEHGRLEPIPAGIADHVQHRRDGNTIFQRLQIGLLNGWAICNGIGER